MTRSTAHPDVLDELAAARPADDPDWAASPAGQAVLARSRHLAATATPPVRHRRRLVLGAAGAAVLVAGGGIAVAATRPHGTPPRTRDLSFVMCADAFSLNADLSEADDPARTAAGAVAGCTRYWETTGGGIVPGNLVSCVYPAAPNQADGGRAVFPAPAGLTASQACAQLGAPWDNS